MPTRWLCATGDWRPRAHSPYLVATHAGGMPVSTSLQSHVIFDGRYAFYATSNLDCLIDVGSGAHKAA